MSKYSKTIKNPFPVSTYEDTKGTCVKIKNLLENAQLLKLPIDMEFCFQVGDIGCRASSLKKFGEMAYGYDGYELTYFQIYQISSKKSIFISVTEREIYVSCTEKAHLEKIVGMMSDEDKNLIKEPQRCVETYCQYNQYNIGSIQGSHNQIVQGNGNHIDEHSTKQKKKEGILKTIADIVISALRKWFNL